MSDVLVTSKEYDSRFASLIEELEKCGYSDERDCRRCPLEDSCRQLFDSLCDKKTHYILTDKEFDKFMAHFRGLRKQLIFL